MGLYTILWRFFSLRGSGRGIADRARIRVQRVSKKFIACRKFDDLSEIHYRDTVGKILYNGKVMSDKHYRKTEPRAKIVQKIYYLRLNRNVQSGNRFIRDDQIRIQNDRTGNSDTLALTA